MIGCFVGTAIDTLVLIVLLKTLGEEDIEVITAFIIALVASLGTTILSVVLAFALTILAVLALGIDTSDAAALTRSPAVILAAIVGMLFGGLIGAAGLGAVLSKMYGLEIKRAFLIASIFTIVHVAIGVGFRLMFG